MRACVVGLGKIGLPLAVRFAESGIDTSGVDIDPVVVEAVGSGTSPFGGEEGLDAALREVVEARRLTATTSTREAVTASDVIVIVVPVLVDESGIPDFAALDDATLEVARGLQPGALVIVETTVPVGTTRNRVTPILEEVSGLEAGHDLKVAFSPERVSSGTVFRDLRRYPKLVGGIDDESAKAAAAFYEQALVFDPRDDLQRPNGVWVVESAEAAELTKLTETVYRDVNIALANEFARQAEEQGLDIWEIITAANSQPFSHIHRPGISVGGHCIPVYPHLYLATDPDASLPAHARRVNLAQPARLVNRLLQAAGSLEGRRVVVLGASYRNGVKEAAFSGVFELVRQVKRSGGIPLVHDPLFEVTELESLGFDPYSLGDEVDYAIVHTDHDSYRRLGPDDLPGCKAILDGRAVIETGPFAHSGVEVITIGVA